MFFVVETLLDFGFHTLSLMNSKYPSTIWGKNLQRATPAPSQRIPCLGGWFMTNIKEQEGFLRCQTPTSAVRLKVEGCRVKNGGWRIKS
jgi:hypothetical protein